jgi:hypothetical protein
MGATSTHIGATRQSGVGLSHPTLTRRWQSFQSSWASNWPRYIDSVSRAGNSLRTRTRTTQDSCHVAIDLQDTISKKTTMEHFRKSLPPAVIIVLSLRDGRFWRRGKKFCFLLFFIILFTSHHFAKIDSYSIFPHNFKRKYSFPAHFRLNVGLIPIISRLNREFFREIFIW